MKIKLGDLYDENRMYVPEIVYHELLKLIDGLEKRISSLESKLSETDSDRTTIDFEGDGATKVPTGENEGDIERLNAKEVLADFYHKMASEQKDIPPEFEKTFRKHYTALLAKF